MPPIITAKVGDLDKICIASARLDGGIDNFYQDLYIYDHNTRAWDLRAGGNNIQAIGTSRDEHGNSLFCAACLSGELIIVTDSFVEKDCIDEAVLEGEGIFLEPNIYSIAIIDKNVYLCGAQGLVTCRDRQGRWSLLDSSFSRKGQELAVKSVGLLRNKSTTLQERQKVNDPLNKMQLYCIAGASENEIYICGKQGVCLYWNGTVVKYLTTYVESALTRIFIDRNTSWIRGLNGTVIFGNAVDGFRIAVYPQPGDDFVAVTKYNGKVYTAIRSGDRQGLYTIENNVITRVESAPVVSDLHTLEAAENVLWLAGPSQIHRFDGSAWLNIQLPF